MPRTSMRRLMPLKVSKADWICWFLRPQCLAHATTASALRTLSSPTRLSVELEAGNLELGRRRPVADVEGLDGVAFAQAEALHRAMRHVEQRREVRVVAVAQQQAVARDEPDEMPEGRLDGAPGSRRCRRGRTRGC